MHYLVVDAFASRPFAGNPAAVVPIESKLPDNLLQSIAAEFNLSETAFPQKLAEGRFELRWFTPAREVSLCGHATLATAHALWETGLSPSGQPICFVTRSSGELICRPREGGRIEMDFPATPPRPATLPTNAAEVLGLDAQTSIICVGTAEMNLTLRLPSADHVRRARPDLAMLSAWHPIGVTITAPGDEAGVDFASRFFAPTAGVPEDPVTGSAHCSLAPYWATQLGKSHFAVRQLSARGGEMELELAGNRVKLIGRAVTTMRGEIASGIQSETRRPFSQ